VTLDPNAPVEYLVGHLEDAFARDARLCEQGLHADVPQPGVVRVTGILTSAERKLAIADVVHDLLPGAEVHDESVVAEYPEDGSPQAVAPEAGPG
jgi:hypothetical protein